MKNETVIKIFKNYELKKIQGESMNKKLFYDFFIKGQLKLNDETFNAPVQLCVLRNAHLTVLH